MRLHLIISRHGLPVTRILWTTTSSSSALREYGSHHPASASMVASSRTPNIAFANGGYTVAQLLEDVNEVVPLETEPTIFDPEFSGQWGLEDYVVEVGGSECLHFMEVDGLLRDGDEVVIRALQLADLRARRLCGRHQITGDGKHLIDGVPFGMPFYKRSTATRPAITIPPRKKRRTAFSGWDQGPAFGYEDANADVHAEEAGDEEWLPPNNAELSVLPPDYEVSGVGTVIRHPVNYSGDMDDEANGSEDESNASEEEVADSAAEADELEDELKALKEEFEEPASQFIDIRAQSQMSTGPALRASSVAKRPSSANSQGKSSLVGASSLSSKRSRGEDSSPRSSKAVRFDKGEQDVPRITDSDLLKKSSASSVTSDSSDESDSESDDDDDGEDEDEQEDDDEDEESSEEESSVSSSDDSDDSSSSSEEDTSEDEDEEVDLPPQKIIQPKIINPPGEGSTRTKKSNQRFKLRRRLSKLKELGVLPQEADFAALRTWEEQNGGWHVPDETSILSTTATTKAQRKEEEQREFQAKREKLLRALASGGVDVDEASEKENLPPPQPAVVEEAILKESAVTEKAEEETSTRRSLDIASSRRLLFGSLGVRTPRTREDEEVTRRKLAAKASTVHNRKISEPQWAEEMAQESDGDNDWENRLVIKAVECIYDDIELSAPPFPFEQRWDEDADALIRQRKGWGKKRKRKQRIQVYGGEEEEGEYEDGNGYDGYDNNIQLNYDNEWPTAEDDTTNMELHQENVEAYHETIEAPVVDDLPSMPSDPASVADLIEGEAKVGAIIAFRQLDMSKATNWQPQMSEYRVAEVHQVLGNGNLNVRLAVRDRRPKAAEFDPEDGEGREYSGFEMPGMDDEDEEDDGYREIAIAEISEPKLLRPAPGGKDDSADRDGKELKTGKIAREDSNVSVVEDSMPNPQLASPPPPIDMDLDETTFVTSVTSTSRPQSPNGSYARASEMLSGRTPGGTRIVIMRSGDADDEHSDTPAVPSPSFSGFHSARSSPGARLGPRFHETGESNLEGHTLIGDQSMLAADNSHQDISTMSFLSANQSFSDFLQDSTLQDRQVVDDTLVSGGNDSLLSVVHNPTEYASGKSTPVRSHISASPSIAREEESAKPTSSQGASLLELLHSGWAEGDNTDQEKDEADDMNSPEDHDSVIHSNQSRHLSPQPSPKPPTSAQQEPRSSPNLNADSLFQYDSPAASTRSKRHAPIPSSQLNFSQTSEIIDLTQSPFPPSPEHATSQDARTSVSKVTSDDGSSSNKKSRLSGRIQEMAEVMVSPATSEKKSKKKKKKRSSGTV